MSHVDRAPWYLMAIPLLFGGLFFGGGWYFDSKLPACPAFDEKNAGTELLSRDMGVVPIGEEECHIIEVIEHTCYIDHYSECKGLHLFCSNKTIARVTKCPSGMVTNSVTRTGGKFSHEEVQ